MQVSIDNVSVFSIYYAHLNNFLKEIIDLGIGMIAVLQTKRSNQIAFLRRLDDMEDRTPRVKVD